MALGILDRFLERGVRQGVLELARPDGSLRRFGTPAEGFPHVRIRLTDKGAERRILRDPRLGAAEAFMDGQLEVEQGDIMDLVYLLRANARWDKGGELKEQTAFKKVIGKAVTLVDGINRAASAKKNIAHHYDVGNDLYNLFLDIEHMQYSCAYWPSDDITLEQAQTAKLAHIAAKLAIEPGQKVLDIGCGWGGMAIYLAKHFDVSVKGITLSEEQLVLARQRAVEAGVSGRIDFELIDYRDLAARGDKFERIVSVGMFEHVGQAQFDRFFRDCATMLDDEGVMLMHTIGRMGGPGSTDAFTRKYIFPGGYIPALSETVEASEKVRLIATDVENLRLHYAKTLREWYKRCVANKEAIVKLHDERFYRMWIFYLSGATAAFESGGMCNYQIQYTRSRHALPLTRDYIAEGEKVLLGA
ncbi:cyclopropane-fatty-acyl-phospholipid synthase family protein [Novosphingobium resinovorum]|jgi:cyclopropane-fatty-acyl-phospholipid synthase|uniref:SAM-dependent methyltransferase n=1 Tax=Sphingomonadaceae TaxID=41297 RepID=UPI00027C990A|nr:MULTISPECIES: cyclopropane-fatty-acyl-phospholipid synthase family protein [Sphingomonadaceae]EJU09501.1 cyclopropane fatty acid synthase [Sphingomonas sp. LH128]MBF7012227.1 class I SAM-dependent methyltransferase [Novosphingobium sp. HR1a]WJM26972.1 cyclopropane-fatty-acyl-phospholipid synthase family protein [Novosphingobium resinovorum]